MTAPAMSSPGLSIIVGDIICTDAFIVDKNVLPKYGRTDFHHLSNVCDIPVVRKPSTEVPKRSTGSFETSLKIDTVKANQTGTDHEYWYSRSEQQYGTGTKISLLYSSHNDKIKQGLE